jgi:hypothetical protein
MRAIDDVPVRVAGHDAVGTDFPPVRCPHRETEGRMSVDERRRLLLADAAEHASGDEAGITLMELLPPVGWADVAGRRDPELLDARFEARLERGFRQVPVTIVAVVNGALLASTAATILSVPFR